MVKPPQVMNSGGKVMPHSYVPLRRVILESNNNSYSLRVTAFYNSCQLNASVLTETQLSGKIAQTSVPLLRTYFFTTDPQPFTVNLWVN